LNFSQKLSWAFASGIVLSVIAPHSSHVTPVAQLTSVSPICTLYSSIQCRAASLLNPAAYYCSCSALSD